MDKQTAAVLEETINEWENKLKKFKADEKLIFGPHRCPLCRVFNIPVPKALSCEECPVKERTGARYCMETPYIKVINAYNRGEYLRSKQHVEECINEEIEFLKSLREEPK